MGLSNQIVKLLTEEAKQKRVPITVNFELLPVCNLDCKMCYIRSDFETVRRQGGLIPADEWLRMAQQLQQAGTLFLLLTGGEIFLYPGFRELYEKLYKMGFVITLNTNATMIDEDTVRWLRNFPPKCVSISLYGATNETYKALCGREGMFDRVDNALRMLRSAGICVECKTMLNPLNLPDLKQCMEYCAGLGIPHEAAVYAFPPARKAEKGEQLRFTPEQAVQAQFHYNRLASSAEDFDAEIVKHLQKYRNSKDRPGSQKYGLTCSASNYSCWISWQGRMMSCAMINDPHTFPFRDGFLAAWEQLKEQMDRVRLCNDCSFCDKRSVCTVCPASCYAETGHVDGRSGYHCQMTTLQLKEMERYAAEHNLNLGDD